MKGRKLRFWVTGAPLLMLASGAQAQGIPVSDTRSLFQG